MVACPLNYDFVRMIFPSFAMFPAPEMCQIAQRAPADEAERKALDEMSDFFFDVVEREDYHMGLRVQQGLEAAPDAQVTFGRNELGNQYFHKWVAYYLAGGDLPEPTLRDPRPGDSQP